MKKKNKIVEKRKRDNKRLFEMVEKELVQRCVDCDEPMKVCKCEQSDEQEFRNHIGLVYRRDWFKRVLNIRYEGN